MKRIRLGLTIGSNASRDRRLLVIARQQQTLMNGRVITLASPRLPNLPNNFLHRVAKPKNSLPRITTKALGSRLFIPTQHFPPGLTCSPRESSHSLPPTYAQQQVNAVALNPRRPHNPLLTGPSLQESAQHPVPMRTDAMLSKARDTTILGPDNWRKSSEG